MVLIPCPECNSKISNQAISCPQCGFPIPKPIPDPFPKSSIKETSSIDKKQQNKNNKFSGIHAIIIIIGFIFLLYNCSGSSDEINTNDESVKSSLNENIEPNEKEESSILIPMSTAAYQGNYFLLSNTIENGISTVIYKSVFPEETIFSKMEVNCSKKQYRKIGEGINNLINMTFYEDKGKWIKPVQGASHDDVIKFVCQNS